MLINSQGLDLSFTDRDSKTIEWICEVTNRWLSVKNLGVLVKFQKWTI